VLIHHAGSGPFVTKFSNLFIYAMVISCAKFGSGRFSAADSIICSCLIRHLLCLISPSIEHIINALINRSLFVKQASPDCSI